MNKIFPSNVLHNKNHYYLIALYDKMIYNANRDFSYHIENCLNNFKYDAIKRKHYNFGIFIKLLRK